MEMTEQITRAMGGFISKLLAVPTSTSETLGWVWWGDKKIDRKSRKSLHPSGKKDSNDTSTEATDETDEDERSQWRDNTEFILSCIAFSVGLGNIWRFPYLAYDNGGAAFLIAYILIQLGLGNTMYLMELLLGQFSGKGPTQVWDMNPAAKGVGMSMVVTSGIIAIYYNVILAYVIYYLFASMQSTLPWTRCKSEWIEKYNCFDLLKSALLPCSPDKRAMTLEDNCLCTGNSTIDDALPFICTTEVINGTSAAELYFYKTVLQRPDDLDHTDIGTPSLALTICLFISTVFAVVCLTNGIRLSGRIVYFTVSYPFVMILILWLRVCYLEGASDGIRYFLVPDFKKLLKAKVWYEAAGQVFFSLSLAKGPIIVYGSYNTFWSANTHKYAIFIANMDLVASLLCGAFVFSTFGILAQRYKTTVDHVVLSDSGLAFVAFPEALSYMEPTQTWAIFFYLMMFTLGIDTQFSYVETLRSCLVDEYHELRYYKKLIPTVIGTCTFLLGLPCVCTGGDYLVAEMDHYGSTLPGFVIGFCEIVSIMWVYGAAEFIMDVEYMCGQRLPLTPFLIVCWVIAIPIIIVFLLLYTLFLYEPPKYSTGEHFPRTGTLLGYILFVVALCPIPAAFLRRFWRSYKKRDIKTFRERWMYLFSPNIRWVPNDTRSLPATCSSTRLTMHRYSEESIDEEIFFPKKIRSMLSAMHLPHYTPSTPV